MTNTEKLQWIPVSYTKYDVYADATYPSGRYSIRKVPRHNRWKLVYNGEIIWEYPSLEDAKQAAQDAQDYKSSTVKGEPT